MPYTFEHLPDALIVVASWSPEFNYPHDIHAFTADLADLLDQQDAPVELILNMGDPALSIADIFDCMKLAYTGAESVYFHAQLAAVYWVTSGAMLHQAAHEVAIPVYTDLDAALEALRGRV